MLVLLVAGCGRLGFDARGTGDDVADAARFPDGKLVADAEPQRDATVSGHDAPGDGFVQPLCGDDLGSMTGPVVVNSGTLGADDSFDACGGAGEPDNAYLWTAPASATYTFDLCNSSGNFDSVLAILDSCSGGTVLGCGNNECPDGVNGRVSVGLAQGQHIVIVVDGNQATQSPNFSFGDYQLGIH